MFDFGMYHKHKNRKKEVVETETQNVQETEAPVDEPDVSEHVAEEG